jgi:regulator of RNase E activity RraA
MNEIRIHPRPSAPDGALIERARALPAAVIGDALGRLTCPSGLRPYSSVARLGRMAGPVLTVRTRPGDNLAVHVAIDRALPGDVIVVDAGGAVDRAIVGELMAGRAHLRGVHGLIIDGAVRDADALEEGEFHMFARGATPAGPYKSGPGVLHAPITIGGVVVEDGDVIVGDGDGLVVIPRHRLEEAVLGGEVIAQREADRLAELTAGIIAPSAVVPEANIVEVGSAVDPH